MRINNLKSLLDRLRVPEYWDLIMVGDGSGSGWESPGGWCGIMLERDRETGLVKYHKPAIGGVNRGSINWLEAMPYWHMLREYNHNTETAPPIDVFIFSDSKWVVEAMSGKFRLKSHRDMRAVFRMYQQDGYRLNWTHVPREVLALNSLADRIATTGREYMTMPDTPSVKGVFPLEERENVAGGSG